VKIDNTKVINDRRKIMNKKLVNCIIPVYNVGRYLVDAVDSITHQTIGFDNINLVIINDGSTDNSQEVIESLRFLYPSIVVIKKIREYLLHEMRV